MDPPRNPESADLACKLAALGWSRRLIARATGLNRPQIAQLLGGPGPPDEEPDDDTFARDRQNARRCPNCGGLVYQWPCLTCEGRARAERIRAGLCKRPA
jgi:hypothetical protein